MSFLSSFVYVISKYRLIWKLQIGSYWFLQVMITTQFNFSEFYYFKKKPNVLFFYCLWFWGFIYIPMSFWKFIFLKPQLHVYYNQRFFVFFLLQNLGWRDCFLSSSGRHRQHFTSYVHWNIFIIWTSPPNPSSLVRTEANVALPPSLYFLKDKIIRKASQECIKFWDRCRDFEQMSKYLKEHINITTCLCDIFIIWFRKAPPALPFSLAFLARSHK